MASSAMCSVCLSLLKVVLLTLQPQGGKLRARFPLALLDLAQVVKWGKWGKWGKGSGGVSGPNRKSPRTPTLFSFNVFELV